MTQKYEMLVKCVHTEKGFHKATERVAHSEHHETQKTYQRMIYALGTKGIKSLSNPYIKLSLVTT